MAKHPAARRVHRAASDEDAFVAGVLESGAWAKTHGRTMMFAVGAVLVSLLVVFYWRNHNERVNNLAAMGLAPIRQTVLEGNRQLAMKDLKAYLVKYANTPSGDEARLLLAQIYMQEGQASNAISTIKPLAKDAGDPSGASAGLLLGAAYELAKQLPQAEQAYLNVADGARFGFDKREALERAAAIRIQRGNAASAAELYDRAMKTLPEDSPERVVYEMRMAEVQAARQGR